VHTWMSRLWVCAVLSSCGAFGKSNIERKVLNGTIFRPPIDCGLDARNQIFGYTFWACEFNNIGGSTGIGRKLVSKRRS